MGVQGLLQCLKEIQDPVSLEQYRGKTLAIDTYGWLHRAIVSCAEDLCLGKPTRNYITYVINKINMLRHFGIIPYFVFDGASLPTKQETNKERFKKRQEAKELAEKYLNIDNNPKLANKQFMKAAYVTSQMSKSIMCELDMMGIKYIVAPYEADPQMVYLEKIGLVDGILSEDSDLLIFGCKKLITKLKDDATCIEINRENFKNVKKIPYLNQLTNEQIRLVAILSGCDYTKGIPGIGLIKAFQLIKKYKNLEKVLIALRSIGKSSVSSSSVSSSDFLNEVKLANLAFQFQKVFDPRTQQLTTLNEYPKDIEFDQKILEQCCGKTFTPEIYQKLCNGKIHPNTHEILVSREQSLALLQSKSVYSPSNNKKHNQFKSLQHGNYYSSSSSVYANRSKSEGEFTKIIPPGKSVLDLLKVSKRPLVSEIPKTPEREFKRAKVIYGTKELKLSPTNKKLKKLIAPSPKGLISKFFKPKSYLNNKSTIILPTPSSAPVDPMWNSSLLNDSEISETSSPHKPINTKNILADLTDNDNDEREEKEEGEESKINRSNSGKITNAKDIIIDSSPIKENPSNNLNNLNEFHDDKENKFDIYSNDDEIEESPIKNQISPKIENKLSILRENFLYQSTNSIKLCRKNHEFNGSPKKRIPLQSKSINLPIKKSPIKLSKKSMSFKQVDASPEHDDNNNNRNHDSNEYKSPIKRKKNIDLRQFAFNGL